MGSDHTICLNWSRMAAADALSGSGAGAAKARAGRPAAPRDARRSAQRMRTQSDCRGSSGELFKSLYQGFVDEAGVGAAFAGASAPVWGFDAAADMGTEIEGSAPPEAEACFPS